MKSIQLFLLCSFLFVCSFQAKAQKAESSPNVSFGIGFTAGWGSTYGFGAEFSTLFANLVDVNVGAGVGISGFKYGAGARLFLLPNRKLSPYFGANYVKSTGFDEVEVSVDEASGKYKFLADETIHLKGGLAWQLNSVKFLFTGGYGFAQQDNDPIFVSGEETNRLRKTANLLAVGGVEASMTIIIQF